MNTPVLKTSEFSSDKLVLIIDKIGAIGEALAQEFSKDYLVVFASAVSPKSSKNIRHISFKRRIPEVPDNNYSKIFVVDDGESITRQSAFSFIRKARELNAPLFFIGSIRNLDVSHADEVAKEYSGSKVLIFGDLFDKEIFFEKDSSISQYILQARKNFRIEVAGNGLALNFPITFDDTIKLIIKASEIKLTQKVILLFPPHPTTDISLANTFQKVNPDIKVDFFKSKKERKIFVPPGGQHAISKYDLFQKLKDLDLLDEENRELKIFSKKTSKNKNLLKPVFFLFLAVVFVMLLPLLTTGFYSLLANRELSELKIAVWEGDLEKASKKANNSLTFFNTAIKTSTLVMSQAKIVGLDGKAGEYIDKAKKGRDISQASIYILEGVRILGEINRGKSMDPKTDFIKASNQLKRGVTLVQSSKAEGDLPRGISLTLSNLEPFVDLFSGSSDALVDLFGFENEKKYLILFQDNLVIRPGGGLISNYGLLTVKNGRITSFATHDSDKIDSEIKAAIEPPFVYRRYLSTEKLYFRDSNFSSDFVTSAIRASNIYSLETGDRVDGVIGVDFAFIKNILFSIGQVNLEKYDKILNEENLYKLAQENMKDLLPVSAKAIEESFELKKVNYSLLAENIGKSINEKHLIFAFADPSAQNVFTANGWSSSLWDNRKNEAAVVNDYLGIVETNLDQKRINYFVSRSINKKLLVLNDGKVSSKISIGLKNNSPKDSGLGIYKSYFQLILPEGSKITAVSVDNSNLEIRPAVTDPRIYESSNFNPPVGIEIEERREMDKSIFGFLVSVSIGEVKTFTISYDLPYTFPLSQKSVKYSLKYFKQPGIEHYPLDLSFSLPPNFILSGSKKVIEEDLRIDKTLDFNIVQK